MRYLVTSLVVAAALLGGAGASLAQSPDFTITVPVRLTTLPARYVGGEIRCRVVDASEIDGGSVTQQFTLDPNVGTLSRDFLLNIRTTYHPSRVRRYHCDLSLLSNVDGRARLIEGGREIQQKFSGSTVSVSGDVPR
jgi:hypothetical protein